MTTVQLVTFSVNGNHYGIPILRVREVLTDVKCSPVPGAHPAIVGLMNLRGQVVTVIDLGKRLDEQTAARERNTCVILKTDDELVRQGLIDEVRDRIGDDAIGLLVDDMGEVTAVEAEDFDEPPARMSEAERRMVLEVVTLEDVLLTEVALERVLDLAA